MSPNGKCAICDTVISVEYEGQVCISCDKRAVNSDNKTPAHIPQFDDGDNPVFVDGIKCWRRNKFGGFVTMRDLHDCAALREFNRKRRRP